MPPQARASETSTDTQLVAEPARTAQLAVAQAEIELPLGRSAEARRRPRGACEIAQLVEVRLADLDLDE